MEKLETCPLCDSIGPFEIVHQTKDYLHPTDEIFIYVQCQACNLVFQNPRPQKIEMPRYYYDDIKNFYFKPYNKLISYVVTLRAKREISKFNRVIKKLSGIRALDIGCGFGHYLGMLRDLGNYEVIGIEPDQRCCELGKKLYNIEILLTTIESVYFAPETFDIIIMRHVLEHIHDFNTVLDKVNKLMKKDGILVIEVPAFDTWEAKIFYRYWVGWEPPRHLFVFSRGTLERLLTRHSLKPVFTYFEAPPNQFINSIRNFFNLRENYKAIARFFNTKNYFLLFLFFPISFVFSRFNQSGRLKVICKKG